MTLTLQRRLADHLAAATAEADAHLAAEAWTLAACRRRDALFLEQVLKGRIIAAPFAAFAIDAARRAAS